MPHVTPMPPPPLTGSRRQGPRDGDDMTYSPVNDNRTGTQRLDELAAAVLLLTQKVNTLERRLENLQGD